VKDKMGPNPPKELQKLVDRSIRIDDWLFKQRIEKIGRYSRSYGTQETLNNDPQDNGDKTTGTLWTSVLWNADGPHDQVNQVSGVEVGGKIRKKRSVEGKTCTLIMENPGTK
jgi:hypothetical protein